MAEKTKSKTSPKGGKRGCLCEDGKYRKECCNGDLQNQGVGQLNEQTIVNIVNLNVERTTSTQH